MLAIYRLWSSQKKNNIIYCINRSLFSFNAWFLYETHTKDFIVEVILIELDKLLVNYWDIYSYSLWDNVKPLNFHQKVNQERVDQCKSFLVHGIMGSLLLTNLPSSTRSNHKLMISQHHFNSSHCSYLKLLMFGKEERQLKSDQVWRRDQI